MTRALFIGRFQPFHKGHLNAVTAAAENSDLTVGIGSAQKQGTMKNPLSFAERKKVLTNCIPDTVPIVRLEDKADNAVWTEMVEETVDFDIVISGNPLVRRLIGERGYDVKDPDYLKPDLYSGTEIRRRIVAGEDWQHLVPNCSLTKLQEFDLVKRLQQIAED